MILVVLSDEENGGDFGAKFLIEEHPGLFEGVRHALGEAGGISQVIAGKRFYPIQLGEKQICWLKATVRGPGGHGAMIHRDGTMARLARMLDDLNRKRMPIHVTPIVRDMIETMGLRISLRILAGFTAARRNGTSIVWLRPSIPIVISVAPSKR